MVQEQQQPQRPGTDPATRELEPMQRPDDMPQLDEERQLEHEEGSSAPQEWSEPTSDMEGSGGRGDAAPPIGSEVEPTTDGAGATTGGEQAIGTEALQAGSEQGAQTPDEEIPRAS